MEAILYYLSHSIVLNKVYAFCSLVLYALAAGIGGFDAIFISMISLTILDYFLGFIYSWKENNIIWGKLTK